MKSLGFRAEPLAIHWALVSGDPDSPTLEQHGTIKAPAALKDEAQRLSHLRNRVLETIETYGPDVAAVRFPETFRKSNSAAGDSRIRVEGVVLEACASQNLEIVVGGKQAMASRLKTKDVTGYLKADQLRGMQWPAKKAACREAIMAATSALES